MAVLRTIQKVWRSRPTIEGAGVHLKRAFGNQEAPRLDPFLLLDDFRSDDPSKYLPGFPGTRTAGSRRSPTFSRGTWSTGQHGKPGRHHRGRRPVDDRAAAGIVHQEMPRGDARGRMGGFQLWANLPASHKMMDPRYRDVKRGEIPEVSMEGGALVKIVCGRGEQRPGARPGHRHRPGVPRCRRPDRGRFTHPVKKGHTVFAYVIEGSATFGTEREFLVRVGDPCPLRRRGRRLHHRRKGTGPLPPRVREADRRAGGLVRPIVMNTDEEIRNRIRRVPERDLHQAMTHKRAGRGTAEFAEVWDAGKESSPS